MPKNDQSKSVVLKMILRRILHVIIALIVVIAVVVGGFYVKFQLEVSSTQTSMKEYLQNKYKREFVIEKPEYKGGGLAVEGGWVANANRKGSSNKFLVLEKGSSYRDNYLNALYNEREMNSLYRVIDTLGIKDYKYMVDISIDPKVADNTEGTPALSDMLSQYGVDITYGVYVIKTGNLPNQKDVENLKILVEYVKSKNPSRYAVRYVINSRTDNSRYLCHYHGGTGDNTNIKNLSVDCFTKYEGKE